MKKYIRIYWEKYHSKKIVFLVKVLRIVCLKGKIEKILLNLYTPSYHNILTNMKLNSIVNAFNHLYKLISSQVPREEKAGLPLLQKYCSKSKAMPDFERRGAHTHIYF